MTERIDSDGIILSVMPHGETSAVVTIFSQEAGLIRGYAKGARQKKYSGTFQKGNSIHFSHTRRLTDQLGNLEAETLNCIWSELAKCRLSFRIFNNLCDLKLKTLAVSVQEPLLYSSFNELIDAMMTYQGHSKIIKRAYVDYLYYYLAQIGYAPDFSRCAVTGTKQDLCYVSPKTARAVCREVGHDYKDRLLNLPAFLVSSSIEIDTNDIIDNELDDALKILTLCFQKFIFTPRNIEPIIFHFQNSLEYQ